MSLRCQLVAWTVLGLFSEINPVAGIEPGRNSQVVVAWNDRDSGQGRIRAFGAKSPWQTRTSDLAVGRDPVVRSESGRIVVVSPTDNTVQLIDPRTWTVASTWTLPDAIEPLDAAIVDAHTAYVTGRNSGHLWRLNLETGEAQQAVDLTSLADADGQPDLGMMIRHGERLFVQVRRMNVDVLAGFVPPSYLAVIDLQTGQQLDVDPSEPGVQAIELAGTPPKMKMQILPDSDRLFLSATGGFFDAGGLEAVDLQTLKSLGLVVREADGRVGADVGPFAMVDEDRGFLVFSTDFAPSSHVLPFSVSQGPADGQLHVSVDYLAPALLLDAATGMLFFPHAMGIGDEGVHVFDATTGKLLTDAILATSGPPTDLALAVLVPEPATAVLLSLATSVVLAGAWIHRRRTIRASRFTHE